MKLCPQQAIDFPDNHCGDWYVSDSRFGLMVHAQLFPGQENSGRLVSLLKAQARERARALGLETILCDGSPGVGCPVISSLSGASLAVGVVEPTPPRFQPRGRSVPAFPHPAGHHHQQG